MGLLKAFRALPLPLSAALLAPLLPIYPLVRRAQARRLASLFAASPFAGSLSVPAYYRRRLGLLLGSLDLHGRPLDRIALRVEGAGHYRDALRSGKPVALMGLHMGAVELLHRLPEAPEGRPFRIVTAGGFAGPLTDFMRAGRERDGKTVLSNQAMAEGLREVIDRGGVLAFMADQHPGEAEDWLRLWDRIEMPWPRRLIDFLRRQGFVILPVSTYAEARGGHVYRYHEPLPPDGGEDGEEALARDFIEEAVAAAPDQWNWSYPKLRPGLSRRGDPVPAARGAA